MKKALAIAFVMSLPCWTGAMAQECAIGAVRGMTSVASLDLTDEQRRELAKQADQGSGPAAMRLYEYFEFRELDREAALAWLKKAAQAGHPGAIDALKRYPE